MVGTTEVVEGAMGAKGEIVERPFLQKPRSLLMLEISLILQFKEIWTEYLKI